jgi:diketogulonate reductase-like aldo/keto reductase
MQNSLPLNNKHKIPVLGLGTWKSEPDKVGTAVKTALNEGCRHIDCAAIYGNEPEIGQVFDKVFSAGEISREDVFVTSKLWNTEHHPDNVEVACKQTLKDLQLDYLDMYLMHWGIAFAKEKDLEPVQDGFVRTQPVSIQQTWQAMESLVEKGLVKSIGVSNFTVPMIVDLLTFAKIKPVMNQVEIHPYHSQKELIQYCHRQQIQVTAYAPLGGSSGDLENKPISDKEIINIASSHSKTPAQVLIKWALQRGTVAIPKSVTTKRIAENFKVFDFELSDEQMIKIDSLNKNHRFLNPRSWWGVPYFN